MPTLRKVENGLLMCHEHAEAGTSLNSNAWKLNRPAGPCGFRFSRPFDQGARSKQEVALQRMGEASKSLQVLQMSATDDVAAQSFRDSRTKQAVLCAAAACAYKCATRPQHEQMFSLFSCTHS